MSCTGKFYLGKDGEIVGPYSGKQMDEFRLNGEILNYTYYWDDSKKTWLNLDPIPPVPGESPQAKRANTQLESGDAICHDFSSVVAGKLQHVTDFGCDFVCKDRSGPPLLGLNMGLVLNLLNPRGDKAINVKAVAHNITHYEEGWIYHLRWTQLPTF